MKNPAIAAEINDTSVAPNNNLIPKRATTSPFSELSDLIAPEMIPIELKLANETRNTDVIPFACSEISFKLPSDCIATNSLDNNFVAITEPDLTASCQGTPAKKANGANTKPINVWKSHLIAPPEIKLKYHLQGHLIKQ